MIRYPCKPKVEQSYGENEYTCLLWIFLLTSEIEQIGGKIH